MAKKLGTEKALGSDFQGQLALWQVLARVLDQGSRLSAVRLAQSQAADSILRFECGFTEDHLYKNLTWLAGRKRSNRSCSKPGVETRNRGFFSPT